MAWECLDKETVQNKLCIVVPSRSHHDTIGVHIQSGARAHASTCLHGGRLGEVRMEIACGSLWLRSAHRLCWGTHTYADP